MAMKEVPPVDYDELVADYKAGWTVKELAVRTGWSQRTVLALLRERGVMITTPEPSHPAVRTSTKRSPTSTSQMNVRAELARRERQADLAEQRRREREADRRRMRELQEARQRYLEQLRIGSSARWYAKTRGGVAIHHAEVEFERREQAQLAQWLQRYGDILG